MRQLLPTTVMYRWHPPQGCSLRTATSAHIGEQWPLLPEDSLAHYSSPQASGISGTGWSPVPLNILNSHANYFLVARVMGLHLGRGSHKLFAPLSAQSSHPALETKADRNRSSVCPWCPRSVQGGFPRRLASFADLDGSLTGVLRSSLSGVGRADPGKDLGTAVWTPGVLGEGGRDASTGRRDSLS